MSGHGHVIPNADGSKARCGGPAICATCARELASAPWVAYPEWMLIDPRYDLQKHAFAARVWRGAQVERDDLERDMARLASALHDAMDAVIWMSAKFDPRAEGWAEWERIRDERMPKWRAALEAEEVG